MFFYSWTSVSLHLSFQCQTMPPAHHTFVKHKRKKCEGDHPRSSSNFPQRHKAEKDSNSLQFPLPFHLPLSLLPLLYLAFLPPALVLAPVPPPYAITPTLFSILLMSLIAHILLLQRVLFFFYCPVMHESLPRSALLPTAALSA